MRHQRMRRRGSSSWCCSAALRVRPFAHGRNDRLVSTELTVEEQNIGGPSVCSRQGGGAITQAITVALHDREFLRFRFGDPSRLKNLCCGEFLGRRAILI